MRVILTGVTGQIGQELLTQCLANPSITSIIALTRRDLSTTHPKLRTYKMTESDFISYSNPDLVQDLRSASACLWTIGLTPSKARRADDELKRRVSLDYLSAAATAFTKDLQPNSARKFRFIFVSGAVVERDQKKALWYWGDFRRLRGESENILIRHEEKNPDVFEVHVMRPGPVPTMAGTLHDRLLGLATSLRTDILAKAMIELALHGSVDSERIYGNSRIVELGRK
ncbi:putative nucleoside-diphosphate-sugar epimerase [Aspergillus nidulans FGSC A4]|uniref:Nucleoside-diphosphate-sugar epimerase, putative (AFU_orthologue AFUA_8G07320) n=1 Tax=Emericella nidulans (strain FGSC A4 / ATCC 38163 / CBS 112.46 / NRRL 194 / M139) TaxID=227321 RepID=C8VAD5_EMENI|nr:hypothetical protein [Aspergillus nidulans FGSC A4]CBF78288.1 TPA: nucleoside-diphosphate-sugar epimerase, putative (AFU_orthologue; AFUA_8G07320) [Aspergillus nidulans FGSC A4]